MGSFSSRIQQFSKSTDFLGNSGDSSFLVAADELKAKFSFSLNRGMLSKLLYETDLDRVENGIFYALCILLKNADLKRIKSLSSREVESFLRDQNHIAAMGDIPFPNHFVENFRNLLITSIFEYEITNDLDFWKVPDNATYIEKIKAISEFFTLKINMSEYFSEESLAIELVQLEEDNVFIELVSSINNVKQAPNTLPKETLAAIESLVRSVIKSENINLVAE